MSTHRPPVPGTSNAGPGAHTPGRNHNPMTSYDVEGTVRWYDADRESTRFVVHVSAANSRAGRYLGEDVTFVLAPGTDAPDGLLPGAHVHVHARMPRELGTHAPDPVPATSVVLVA